AADETSHALPSDDEMVTCQAEEPSPALASPCAAPEGTLWEGLDREYKQVTVLCGALAEAPALAARLGPEARHHLMRDVLARAQAIGQAYDGTLVQVCGGGFLAVFGAPVALEAHARRAVLAALDLRQRLRAPATFRGQPHGVALHLGLHSGPLVVGPLAYDPQRPYAA